eukprot:UN28058
MFIYDSSRYAYGKMYQSLYKDWISTGKSPMFPHQTKEGLDLNMLHKMIVCDVTGGYLNGFCFDVDEFMIPLITDTVSELITYQVAEYQLRHKVSVQTFIIQLTIMHPCGDFNLGNELF